MVAIGANATGVLAFGQLATGVVAVGQLARGVVTVGQLSLGIVAVGQLAIGVVWAMGQLGIAAFAGPGIVWGPLGHLWVRELRWPPTFTLTEGRGGARVPLGAAIIVVTLVVWTLGAGTGLVDGLGNADGDGPPPSTTTTTRVLR